MMHIEGTELVAEGNNGGDRLEMRVVYQDDATAMIHLKVGSSCVYSINHIVPVELLTSLLTMALGYGDVKEAAPKWLEWDDEINEDILQRIHRWHEFDTWWYENERQPGDLLVAFEHWMKEGTIMDEQERREYYVGMITRTSTEYARSYIRKADLETLRTCLREIEGRSAVKTLRKMIEARIRRLEKEVDDGTMAAGE